MINTLSTSLKAAFNRANPNSLASMLAAFMFGDFLRASTVQLRNITATAAPAAGATPAPWLGLDPYGPASNFSLILPDDAKCGVLLGVYARSGTGTAGTLTVEALGASLSAGQCAPTPNGDIVFYTADAWTAVDVRYTPKEEDIVELTLNVVSGVATLPTAFVACSLLEVQRNDTSTAQLNVTKEAASNSTTATACFNLAKTTILLDSADSATSIRVKFGNACAVNRSALLEAASNSI